MSKEVRKDNKILKRFKTRNLLLENGVLPWKHSIVVNAFFVKVCQDRLHDIMQDSKNLEVKTEFWEFPSSLEVFKIRSLGAHDAMVSEFKCHQKCWNKIIVHRTPEIYASTIPSSTELESLKSHLSLSGSSAESTHFSSSHEMWTLLTP